MFESGGTSKRSTRATNAGQKRKRKGKDSTMNSINVEKEFWLGRIQCIRQKYGTQWGRVRNPIDLLDRPTPSGSQTGSVCQVLCNWYNAVNKAKTQFTYDTTDLQWIDIEMVITSVSLTMKQGMQRIYVLDERDKKALDDYVKTMVSLD